MYVFTDHHDHHHHSAPIGGGKGEGLFMMMNLSYFHIPTPQNMAWYVSRVCMYGFGLAVLVS